MLMTVLWLLRTRTKARIPKTKQNKTKNTRTKHKITHYAKFLPYMLSDLYGGCCCCCWWWWWWESWEVQQQCPVSYRTNLRCLSIRLLWSKVRSPPVSLTQERHTQRCKAANFILILSIFCDENPLKSPPWKHTWWSEHFGKFPKKKKLNRHIQKGKEKSFEIATFF